MENIKIDLNVFKHDISYYTNDINPIKDYIDQASVYVSKTKNVSIEEAKKKVMTAIKKYGVKNPIVKYNGRKSNGDMEITTTTLTNYIESAKANNEVMVPSFTCYIHPSKQKSMLGEFMLKNVKERAVYKKLAFKYDMARSDDKEEQKKFNILAANYNSVQAAKKRNNNGASGAAGSKSTHLYMKSIHYSLTSMTRGVASTGNAISESFIASNKLFMTPDVVMNYITSIITYVDMNKVKECVEKYNFNIPTIEDVMDNIKHCTDKYWNIPEALEKIKNYVSKLTDMERTAVLFVNDFKSIAMLNMDWCRNFLLSIARPIESDPELKTKEDMLKAIDNTPEGIMSMVHHICMEDIRGIMVDYKSDDLDFNILTKLAATAKYVSEELTKNKLLFEAFFTTKIMPCNIANIKDMYRECIVLSDTDSTCGSYDWWVRMVFGEDRYDAAGVGVFALVMTMNTQIMDHHIRIFSGNMNIDKERVPLLKMKNEYFWYIFATLNASKHYFADTAIKEGMVFRETRPEVKGVNMIAGNISEYFRNKSKAMMKKIKEELKSGEQLDIYDYIKEVADIEREIIDKVNKADLSVLKLDKIKEPKSYKLAEKERTPYLHHMLWNEVFKNKYGDPGEPDYHVVKVPLITDSKKAMEDFLTASEKEFPDFVTKLKSFLAKYDKTDLGTFRPPFNVVKGTGIPKEFIPAIDYKRIVNDNCLVFYYILESLGFYRKKDVLISEMGLY